MATIKQSYLLEGMSCAGCERTVTKVVSNIEGVASARADLASATLSFEYDPAKVTIDNVKSAIEKVGYKLVGEIPSNGQRASSDEAVS